MEEKKAFRIGLAGLGTVGVGVVKILQQHADLMAQRAGRPVEIVSVTASSKGKDRGVDLSAYKWAESLQDMAVDPDVDAIIEMIGGSEGTVKEFVETALQNGKHVVTANKALLAHHGYELAQLAEANNAILAYEAAVAGGIPVIKTIREGLAANEINSLYGILNGTCNYILTEMRETGRDFSSVLQEAQEKGYAEADPTFDVEGVDAAHKLTLLGALAFGLRPDFNSLKINGISKITSQDISYAEEFDCRIKLIGMACRNGGEYIQSMEPCLVPKKSELGSVEGVFNAVLTEGDFVDKTMMEGRGAGEGPTASSIVADILDIAKGNGAPAFGVTTDHLKKVQWQGTDNISAASYIHLQVKDVYGVLAEITTCLKDHEVSIDSVIQRGLPDGDKASIAIITHEALFEQVTKAVDALEQLPCVLDKPTLLRIENI